MRKRILKTCLAAALFGALAAASAGPLAAAELVVGTGGVDSAYFDIGVKLVRAIALDVDGLSVNLQSTRGDSENLKLLTRKRRGLQLALARLDAVEAAWKTMSEKRKRKIFGLFSLGKNKDGAVVVLLARKKVSDKDAKAIVGYLLGAKGTKRMKKRHPSWSAKSGSAAFKSAGIPMHPGAMAALRELGIR